MEQARHIYVYNTKFQPRATIYACLMHIESSRSHMCMPHTHREYKHPKACPKDTVILTKQKYAPYESNYSICVSNPAAPPNSMLSSP